MPCQPEAIAGVAKVDADHANALANQLLADANHVRAIGRPGQSVHKHSRGPGACPVGWDRLQDQEAVAIGQFDLVRGRVQPLALSAQIAGDDGL